MQKVAKIAIKKLKLLGEETTKEKLKIIKIQREGEEYYYISSKLNTMEIRVKDKRITRVNSIPV